MTRKKPSLRSALGRVKGLGSAKEGTEHWWQQRVTAIALILLTFYMTGSFFNNVVFGTYDDTTNWLSSPIATTFIILFIVAGFWHAVLGLQVVIEDYVHTEGLKIFSILAVKFIAVGFAVLGILAAITIPLQKIVTHG